MWVNWRRLSLGAVLLASLSLLLVGCGDYSGSSTSQKSVSGVVSDPATGLPMSDAKVTAYAVDASGAKSNTALSSPATVQTNNKGRYTLRIPANYNGSLIVEATKPASVASKLAKMLFATAGGEDIVIQAAVHKSQVSKSVIPPVMVSLATHMVVNYIIVNAGAQAFTPENIQKATVVLETFFGANFTQIPPPSSATDTNTTRAQQDLIVSIQAMNAVAPTGDKVAQVVQALVMPTGLGEALASSIKSGIAQAAVVLAQQGILPVEYTPSAEINTRISNAQSAPVTVNVSDSTPPAAPVGLVVSSTTGKSVTLSWTPSAESDLAGYLVYRADDSGGAVSVGSVNPGMHSFNDFTVLPGGRYNYQVVSFDNSHNLSDPSNTVTASTPAMTDMVPPSAPTGLVYVGYDDTQAAGRVMLKWTMSSKTTTTGTVIPAASYNVYRDGQFLGSATGTSYGDTSTQPGQSYVYYVKAADANANLSPSSQVLSVRTPALTVNAPAAVPHAYSANSSTTGTVTITWDASAETGVTYNVYRDGKLIASGLSGLSYTDAGLVPGTTYNYTVTAFRGGAESSGAAVQASTLAASGGDTVRPNAPSNLSVTNFSSTAVSLMWSAPGSTSGAAAAGYEVFRADSAGTLTRIATVTNPGYVDSGVSQKSSYTYLVASFTGTGLRSYVSVADLTHGFSNAVTVITPANVDFTDTTAPLAPAADQDPTATSSSVSLSWLAAAKANKDATHYVVGYLIYRKPLPSSSTDPGQQIADVPGMLGFVDSTVTPSTSYQYTIKAYDTSGNVSSSGLVVTVTTPAAVPNTYTISGRVTLNGAGLYPVLISTGTTTVSTDVNGYYSISGLAPGSYTLTPSLTGYYQFSPPSRTVSVSGSNVTSDFTATLTGYASTGVAYPDGTIIGGISIPTGTVIGGVYYPYSTVIGGVSYPTSTVIGGVSYPNGTVIGGVSYPAGTIVGGIALPAGAVTTGISIPTGTVIGGVVYATGSVVTSVGYPTGVVVGGITIPSGIVRGGVIYPSAGIVTGASYPVGSVGGGVVYPAGAVLSGLNYPAGTVVGGINYPGSSISTVLGYPAGSASASPWYPSGSLNGGVGYPSGGVSGSASYATPYLLGGRVTYSGNGAAAAGVTVTLDHGATTSVVTNGLGYYFFYVSADNYYISLPAYGLQLPATAPNVAGQTGYDFSVAGP